MSSNKSNITNTPQTTEESAVFQSGRRKFIRYSVLGTSVGSLALLGNGCARGGKKAQDPRLLAAGRDANKAPVRRRRVSVRSEDAMRVLTDTIAEINRDYFSERYFFRSAQDIAEGQRYLLHLINAATEFYLEGDADHPWFVNMITPVRKYMGDNPDALYVFTKLHGN